MSMCRLFSCVVERGCLLWPVRSLGRTLLVFALLHWKRLWCWEGLGAVGEGDDRGWDGWMASPTQWTWVWVNSGSWWWTGRPGVLQLMGSQRVGHDWATELNWTASFCTPWPNLPVTPGVSWLPIFAFQSPIMKMTSFLGVNSRRSCRASQNC